jgi:hypothetical protein
MFGKQQLLFWPPFPLLYVWEAAAIFLPTLLSSPLSFANDKFVQLQKNYLEYKLMIMNL